MAIPSRSTKKQILIFGPENRKKAAVKRSIEQPILFNFVNLSRIVCPRLSEET